MASLSAQKLAPAPNAAKAKARLIKLITFDIGKLNLAIRIDQVYKVVNIPAVHGSGLNPVGLARVDNQDVTVVDLHRRLFRSEAAAVESYYLVLVKTGRGELLGIPASQTPLMTELPATLIRSLPDSYRRSDTLEIASHIAVLPAQAGEQASRTLFLLDVEMLAR
ncbi:MAG: chemotaxis protein CheW [Pegethrix bostrychoides GSE-TBD4-15B]|jgi:purine-binding chemotaxis protein CheW|uniref:Chemotaxis protein CheW n=1 Tax=Pegethrix bostrychoides GSE-TBD4-15B TaxID=2839662 RepID=A0A951U6T9_9CYAN|nr:chemotaxis protein CheW [Pegethrix bostrychoides GSE-TBD4-15B]